MSVEAEPEVATVVELDDPGVATPTDTPPFPESIVIPLEPEPTVIPPEPMPTVTPPVVIVVPTPSIEVTKVTSLPTAAIRMKFKSRYFVLMRIGTTYR